MALIARMHSSESPGFNTARGYHAVFHDFDDCHYQQSIIRSGHSSPGRGQDDTGRARDLCSNCLRLGNQLLASQGQGSI